MRNKSLYLLLACVCGTIAAIFASQWLKAQANNQGNGRAAEIFVATVAIEVGEKITPERIQLEQWPVDKVPPGSTKDLSVLENKYARQPFYAGEPIMPVKLMDENWSTVPKGSKVVSMKASDVSIANLLQPGDRVDVIGYFPRSELIPRSMTKAVLMGIRVYALDGNTERIIGEDRPKTFRNIELLIHEKDAEAWVYANELGKIRLNLGSDSDYSNSDGSNEAGQEFLQWLAEHRQQQEESQRQKELDRQRPTLPLESMQASPGPEQKEEEGFRMHKLHQGKIIEYWIVPGKPPVVIGEADSESGSSRGATELSTSTMPNANDYEYLNGEFSPFFESDNRSSTKNE